MEENKDLMTAETSLEEEKEAAAEETAEVEKVFCVKCGAEIAPGTVFCPKCGHKVGEKLAVDTSKIQDNAVVQTKAPKKKILGIIIGAVVVIAAIVAAILLARGVQAKDVTLNKKSASVKVGETVSLSYTINPSDTKDKTVTWTSSNESIAF